LSGLIITLRKNPFSAICEEKNSNSEYIVLGHYDRLEVRKPDSFPDFYYSTPEESSNEVETESLDLCAEIQRICLLRLPNEPEKEDNTGNNGNNNSISYVNPKELN